MKTDERNGLPSASKMDRVANCPWSHKAELYFPSEETSEAADSGTRIHAVLAGAASMDTLSIAEQETAGMCAKQAEELQAEWETEGAHLITLKEERLWLHKGGLVMRQPGAAAKFSGQADLIVIDKNERRALVIDYKTGRGEQAEAVDNPQLASLAVLVANLCDCDRVRVALVQPWAGKPTVADYDVDALDRASEWLNNALHAAEFAVPGQARAGDHCKWCKAASNNACNAFRVYTSQVPELLRPDTVEDLSPKEQMQELFARAMRMPAGDLANAISKLTLVNKAIDALKDAAKERAANDPEFQQFYTLREKAGRRSITDVGEAFSRSAALGVSVADFTAACKVPLSSIRELVGKATGQKGKALDAVVDTVLDGIVEQSEPSIELQAQKGGAQ
jgi:hypothetical protein